MTNLNKQKSMKSLSISNYWTETENNNNNNNNNKNQSVSNPNTTLALEGQNTFNDTASNGYVRINLGITGITSHVAQQSTPFLLGMCSFKKNNFTTKSQVLKVVEKKQI